MKASLVSTLLLASAAPAAAFAPSRPVGVMARPTFASRRALIGAGTSSINTPSSALHMSAPPTEDTKKEEIVNKGGASDSFEGGFNTTAVADSTKSEEELSETKKLLAKVKEAGTAGIISYALWELGFWFVSIPVVLFGYYEVAGHWPDLRNAEDTAKLGAEAFAFVNFARFAVPLRIGLALSTTPWIEENIVERFMMKKDGEGKNGEETSS